MMLFGGSIQNWKVIASPAVAEHGAGTGAAAAVQAHAATDAPAVEAHTVTVAGAAEVHTAIVAVVEAHASGEGS